MFAGRSRLLQCMASEAAKQDEIVVDRGRFLEAWSLRGRNDRREKVENRDQILTILTRIVVLLAEKSGGYGPILGFRSRLISCREDSLHLITTNRDSLCIPVGTARADNQSWELAPENPDPTPSPLYSDSPSV